MTKRALRSHVVVVGVMLQLALISWASGNAPSHAGKPCATRTGHPAPAEGEGRQKTAPPGADGAAGLKALSGYQPLRTLVVGDPVSAGGGEFRQSWRLFDLGGAIPVRFHLLYAPDLRTRSPYNDGRTQFPPWENNSAFTSDTVFRIVEFTEKSSGERYVNVFVGDDALALKEESPGNYQAVGPVRYQIQKSIETGYYYFMDPESALVTMFRSRPAGWDLGGQIIERFGEATLITDRNGNGLSFSYNADNNPTAITDGLGRTLSLVYLPGANIADRHLSSVSDGYGRSATFGYAQFPCALGMTTVLQSFTDVAGESTSFEYYDPVGTDCTLLKTFLRPMGNSPVDNTWTMNASLVRALSRQSDAYGHATSFGFTLDASENSATSVTLPDASQVSFLHRDARYPLSLTDEAGKGAVLGLNADSQMTSITDRMGGATSCTYHPPTGMVQSITNAQGHTVTMTYTPQEQVFTNPSNAEQVPFTFYDLVKADHPDGTSEQFTRDSRGNALTRIDAEGKTWSTTYDPLGRSLTETNPDGGVVTNTYNSDGTLASTADSDGVAETYTYDAFGRLWRIVRAGGSTMEIAYDLNDRVTAIRDENGHSTTFAHDANGNLISVTDAQGHGTAYGYDLMDRVNGVTDRLGKSTNLTYDTRGRVQGATDPNGIAVSFAYDARGRRTGTALGGQPWQTAFDDEGIPVSTTTPMGRTSNYQTDALGRTTALTDALLQTSTLTRDSMGRVSSATDPLGRTTTYGYDGWGLLARATVPALGESTYRRNGLGLLSGITDLNGSGWTFGHGPMGRLTAFTDPLSRTWQYTYDPRGRLDVTSFPDGSGLFTTYDAASKITGLTFGAGPDLTFTYDAVGRMLSTNGLSLSRDAQGQVVGTDNAGAMHAAAYDAGGRLASVTYGDTALTVTYAYDAVTGLLNSVSDSLTGTCINLAHDADGNLTTITRPNGVHTNFLYDEVGRVSRKQDTGVLDLTYTLDAAGQVTGAAGMVPLDPADLLATWTDQFTYDAASQVNSPGFTYDPQGRRTTSQDHTFVWDGASRLTGIGGADLFYNGLGDLTARAETGETVLCSYNKAIGLSPMVAERNGAAGPYLRFYVWTPTGELLYLIDAAGGNQVYHYHFDRIGSTLALTDSGGVVTDSYAYGPYGELLGRTGTNPQPFTFVGRWGVRREGTFDLYQMRARYYDARTGAFLSKDPVWPILDPKELNPYGYASRDPLRRVDVGGMAEEFGDSFLNMPVKHPVEPPAPPAPPTKIHGHKVALDYKYQRASYAGDRLTFQRYAPSKTEADSVHVIQIAKKGQPGKVLQIAVTGKQLAALASLLKGGIASVVDAGIWWLFDQQFKAQARLMQERMAFNHQAEFEENNAWWEVMELKWHFFEMDELGRKIEALERELRYIQSRKKLVVRGTEDVVGDRETPLKMAGGAALGAGAGLSGGVSK
jgi:RHS repeat-associated protein